MAPHSLLELIANQRTEGAGGLRIEIFPALVDPVSPNTAPLHFYGLHGKTFAAVQHYAATLAAAAAACGKGASPGCVRASCTSPSSPSSPSPSSRPSSTPAPAACPSALPPKERPMLVAAVAANGVNGRTAWSKDLRISAEDVALLAGHPRTAEALQHIQDRVPLMWRRDNHHRFPRSFRDEMRGVVEGLIHSSWFPALPGPTRLGVVAAVAQDLTRHRVWGMLSDAEWNRVVQVLQGLPAGEEVDEEAALPGPSSREALQQQHMEQASGPAADASAVTAEQGPAGGGDEDGGAFHADAHDQGDVASPQLVIRLEPRFALGAGAGGYGRRSRLLGRLGGWGWLLRSVFPIAMWGLSLKVASKREALLTVVAYLAGASCVL